MQSEAASPPPVYRALSSDSEIRLVGLLPCDVFEAPIECRLEHAIIGNCRPYEALSYVWGGPEFTESITLDSLNFMVTPRLATALRYLRLRNKERALWIDAICINQHDLAERQQQIGYMRAIYSSCTSDIVWLGPGENDGRRGGDSYSKGMKAIRRLAALAGKPGGIGPTWANIRSCANLHHTQYLIQNLLHYNAVWKRVWIMQEISCSRKVFLMNGHDTLDWSLVEKIAHGGDYYTDLDAFHGSFSHTSDLSVQWTMMFGTAKMITNQREVTAKILRGEDSLLDVLARFKHTRATDPRDKIYGLLGLVRDTIGVEADYAKSTTETYIGVTIALINASANLDILCQCPWARQHNDADLSPLEGLPTWAPDYRITRNGKFLFAQRGIYSAGRARCLVPCVVQKSTICLKGYSLGHIQASKNCQDTKVEYMEGSKHSLVLRDWAYKNLVTDSSGKIAQHKYHTGEDQLQAFWRTLVGDCKGYPQERLTSDDIVRNQTFVRSLVDDSAESTISKRTLTIASTKVFRRWIALDGWRFYTSDNGLFVLAQPLVFEGDVIAILDGAKTPVVLRPLEKKENGEELYTFMCGAYVHGFMDGEVYEAGAGYTEKVFRLA